MLLNIILPAQLLCSRPKVGPASKGSAGMPLINKLQSWTSDEAIQEVSRQETSVLLPYSAISVR